MSQAPIRPFLIWLADDSRTQMAFTERALGGDYQFERFDNGTSVIERLQTAERLPDVLLLDWMMPGLTGDEVCRRIRTTDSTRELPVVIVTASRVETEDVVVALDSGANDYVAKPFAPEELRARVSAILREAQVKRAAEQERRRVVTINKLGRALLQAENKVDVILGELATALVAGLCDGCTANLLPGATAGCTVVRHRSPDGAALLEPLGGITDPVVHGFASTERALTGLPSRYAAYVRACGLRGLAVMILPVRGLAQGVVTLTRDQPSEPFDAHDLAAIETCLEYAGLAIEAAIRSEAERATTRFHEEMLGIVGHDLRNPLAAMAVGIELLRARETDPASVGVIQRIENSARRMTTLVDQLFDVTRVRLGGGIPIAPQELDLHTLVSNVLDEVRLAHRKTVFELRGESVRGTWDPGRLGQVIANLTTNAAVYGRPGGPVIVEIAEADGVASLVVSNPVRDVPVAPDLLKTLFDPFKRGRSGNHPGGLGLGLYIVQEIVHAHNGTITVTSTADGTTFRALLPVEAAA